MILSDVQKKTIAILAEGDSVTFGGITMGENLRYEVQRVTSSEYKVGVFALMLCLNVDYMETTNEVIQYIEMN